jgi:hypothetical protein
MEQASGFKSIEEILHSVGSSITEFITIEKERAIFRMEEMKDKLMEAGINEADAKELALSLYNHIDEQSRMIKPSN